MKYLEVVIDVFSGVMGAAMLLLAVFLFLYLIGAIAAVVAAGFMHTYATLVL